MYFMRNAASMLFVCARLKGLNIVCKIKEGLTRPLKLEKFYEESKESCRAIAGLFSNE